MIGRNPVIAELSAALDEVYRLRAILADEARQLSLRRHSPQGRVNAQISRMRAAAKGDRGSHRYLGISGQKEALRSAGADECLTRYQFACEVGLASEDGHA